MLYQKPPKPKMISRRAIDRAGDVLISETSKVDELEKARDILNQWRARHVYPLNTFNSYLRSKVRNGRFGIDVVIAQRLKRASTIINKLREGEDHDIKLLNMQDIAGVRAILPTITDVRKLEADYKLSKRFSHILHPRSKDYIQEPKIKDGYRSTHLVYKYQNRQHPRWDGLWVELQIRTKLQHTWATAVETMHAFLGKAIKTRQGQKSDEKWTEYFRLVSSAFAYIEKTPLVDSHKNMRPNDIQEAIRKYEAELKALEKLRAFPVAIKMITEKASGSTYHLIVLDTRDPNNKTVTVRSYGRDDAEKANADYAETERQFLGQGEVEPVLVSSTNFKEAYSSFFADTKDFQESLGLILSGKWLSALPK